MSKSAAERQRESRQRKRDIVTPENVTHVTKPERDISSVTGPASIKAMSDTGLQFKLNSYPGASWVNSLEHQEVLRRRQAAGAAI